MSDHFIVRGYAAPFSQPAAVDGLHESIRAGAFDLGREGDVRLLFGLHSNPAACASTGDGSMTLFQDGYGLAFEARIPASAPDALPALAAIRANGAAFASVNFAEVDEEYRLVGPERFRCIKGARIDHIAICSKPVYGGTGVWLASEEGYLPSRLAAHAARWHAGTARPSSHLGRSWPLRGRVPAAAGNARISGQRLPRASASLTCAGSSPAASLPRKPVVPASVIALDDPQHQAHARQMRNYAARYFACAQPRMGM